MTLGEAITAADALRRNMIPEELKLKMLSELDGKLYYGLIYPDAADGEFNGYTSETASDTQLLVPYPYDALYVPYLEAEICRINGETARYNSARMVFEEKYGEYADRFVRTHKYAVPDIRIPVRRY